MLFLFENFILDTERRELLRGDELRSMEPQVFDLIEHLVRNRGRVVSKDDMISSVWNGRIVSDATLASRISAARSVLGDNGREQRVIRTMIGKGVRFVADVQERQEWVPLVPLVPDQSGKSPLLAAATHALPLPLPDKPSIAVMPFQNMSGDPEQNYFADGVVEDIINGLSRIKWLFVISRNSSFSYRNQIVDTKRVGGELGIRYILEGSIRRAGTRIRIAAQLVEVTTGRQVWAERYDRDIGNIFELQDDITSSVVGAIEPNLIRIEIDRSRRKRPDSLDAYDLYLQALPHVFSSAPADCERAIILLSQALQKEPDYATAHAAVAWCIGHRFGNNATIAADKAAALAHARAALLWAGDDASVLALAGFIIALLGNDYDSAFGAINRALAVSNSSALAYGIAANVHGILGHIKETESLAEKALRLSPFDPLSYLPHLGLAVAHYKHNSYSDSVAAIRRAVQANPRFFVSYLIGAAALVRLGQLPEAKAMVQHSIELRPDYTTSTLLAAGVGGPELAKSLASALRQAGLPE
ncbi:MAG TPA: winged helix-turn-helix domain-containing tetratricopeptide repeat protein [Terracidiphilus sp.]|jgi:TolB-like protein/Tfp pilus assembly protein PilF